MMAVELICIHCQASGVAAIGRDFLSSNEIAVHCTALKVGRSGLTPGCMAISTAASEPRCAYYQHDIKGPELFPT